MPVNRKEIIKREAKKNLRKLKILKKTIKCFHGIPL